MILETLRMAVGTLLARRGRTALTMMGVVVGVTSIALMLSFGTGLETSINESFSQLGTDTLIVLPGTDFTQSAFARLRNDDAKHIERIAGVQWAAEIYLITQSVTHKSQVKTAAVAGIDLDKIDEIYESGIVEIDKGRLLTTADQGAAVVGHRLATNGFDEELEPKEIIRMEGTSLRITGTLKKGTNTFGSVFDNAILTSKETVQATGKTAGPSRIMVQANPGTNLATLQAKIEKRLEDQHDAKDFTVMTPTQLAQSLQSILGIVQIVLLGLASISLLVGGLGIMNTMFMSVTERVHEIGVMKALGASQHQILLMFLAESALIGLVGSAVGVVLAIGGNALAGIALTQAGIDLAPRLATEHVIGACVFGSLFGILSGTLPARWAAGLEPVVALRFEE